METALYNDIVSILTGVGKFIISAIFLYAILRGVLS